MRSLTPTLDKTTRCMDCVGLPKPCTICAKRLRELRALKAVARWAQEQVAPGAPVPLPGLVNALARLTRASREQSKKETDDGR